MKIETIEDFFKLIKSDDEGERYRLRSDEISYDVIVEIIRNHPEYADTLTINKNLDERDLRALSKSNCRRTRSSVADVRRLPNDVFQELSCDCEETVRASLARNKKCPDEIFNRLLVDASPLVSEAARESIKWRRKP